VTVTPTPIVLPPLPYITPPVKVTQIEQTAPAGAPPYFTIVGAGYIDVAPETTTIKGGEFYRVDTGALVTLATPDNLRISRELQVVSCIDLNAYLVNEGAGKDTPPGVLPATLDCAAIAEAARLANLPTNTFKNTDGTWLEGQISVAFSVTFVNNKLSDWDATNVECAFNGGSLSLGNAVLLWDCSLPLATSLARYNDVSADMGKIMYCPTELVRNAFSEGQRTIQCAA
jgi:hypothetical protein